MRAEACLRIYKERFDKGFDKGFDKEIDMEVDMEMRKWETPWFVEIRMDAEIGAYQSDEDPGF